VPGREHVWDVLTNPRISGAGLHEVDAVGRGCERIMTGGVRVLSEARSQLQTATVYRRNVDLIGRTRPGTVYRYKRTRDPRVCLYHVIPAQSPGFNSW